MKVHPLVMVVCGDREILKPLRRVLALEGFRAITAADGRSALSLLEIYEPDLVLLDITSPVLDGLQVLKLVRQRSDVPTIMLTARRDVTSVSQALLAGADDCVRKPFCTPVLAARIRAKLRRTWDRGPIDNDHRRLLCVRAIPCPTNNPPEAAESTLIVSNKP